jgi:hypothetical protein
MNPITQHHPAAARMAGRAGRAPHRRWPSGQRVPSRAAGAGILGAAAITQRDGPGARRGTVVVRPGQ